MKSSSSSSRTGIHSALSALSVLSALFLGAGQALGQVEVEWERNYGGERGEVCFSIAKTSDGGFALAGSTFTYGFGGQHPYNFWLVRSNSEGEELWSRAYGGQDDDDCFSVIQTSDGGFALAGTSQSFGQGYWLIKVDGDGDSLWSRSYGDGLALCFSIIEVSDGGFALAGFRSTNQRDMYIVRTDENGEEMWTSSIRGRGIEEARSIIEVEEGGFAVGGFGTDPFGNMDCWLVRMGEEGDSLWGRTYGGRGSESCYSLIQTESGGFALAGETSSEGTGDMWLLCTDENGDSLWSKAYGGRESEMCRSLIQTFDGGYALGGETQTFSEGDGWNYWLVRTNANGDSLWSFVPGSQGNEICHSIISMPNGGFGLAGQGAFEDSDFYLIATTPDPTPTLFRVPVDCETIQLAIDRCTDGDTVLIADGTYRGEGNRNISFGGKAITVRSENGPESCIIDAEGEGRGFIFNSSEENTSILQGVSIINGTTGGDGGGVVIWEDNNESSSPTLYDLYISNCSASYGGGIFISGENDVRPYLKNILIHGCDATVAGDGIAIRLANPSFNHVTIVDNDAREAAGGIWFDGCDASFSNLTLTNNSCENQDRGGGIEFYKSVVNLSNAIIWDNSPNNLYYQPSNIERVVVTIGFSDIENGIDGVLRQNGGGQLDYLDGNIDSDPLFLDPDNGEFHLQVTSPCIDAGDPESELDPDVTRADMGAYSVWQTFHNIPLRQGWNLLSSFNQPRDAAFPAVWSEVVSRDNLVMIKDQSGRFYNPNIGENGFSNMQPWDVRLSSPASPKPGGVILKNASSQPQRVDCLRKPLHLRFPRSIFHFSSSPS